MKCYAHAIAYHVYVGDHPTTSGYEGTRRTLNAARRLMRALQRRGLAACVQAACERDGVQWCEPI